MAKSKKSDAAESPEKKPAAAKEAKSAAKPAAEKKPALTERKAPAAEKKAPAVEAKAPEKKAPAKKAAAAPARPAASDLPQVGTQFAAQSAAKMLLNRAAAGDAAPAQAGPTKESASFKNFKDQLAKPKQSSSLSHILGPTVDTKKSTSTFLGQQKGHNQTQGGFDKTGVPRRTNG